MLKMRPWFFVLAMAAAPTAIAGYERHGTADTADGSPHSPGTRIDGSPF
jgi:hypothetical protein